MTIVTISEGKLQGAKCSSEKGTVYFEFLGIPYARPPVGNLRFKSPEPPEPWEDIRDATKVSKCQIACQIDLFNSKYDGNEDCLYLNVYTPKLSSNEGKLLPVMFHIHGGGFLHGNGVIKTETGPDFLIDNNVVVVSINYRLGIFGFLSLDIPEAAGNMGLKDQVQALLWVQNNIEKFGGDKNNVTIFGISAGSASVEYLMLSPKSKGLFHKAILQSGSSLNHWAVNFEPKKLLCKVIHKIGYEGSLENHSSIHKYLMSCPALLLTEKSFEVIQEFAPERVFFGFVPTIEMDFGDGEAFLTTNPYKILKEGSFNRVPVIKGFCEKEGYMMAIGKFSVIEELDKNENFTHHWAFPVEAKDDDAINKKFSMAYAKHINDEKDENRMVDFFSNYDFISGIWVSGQFMSDQGVPVYLYKFSYDGKMNFLKNAFDIRMKGASHADDVTYIFKNEISKLADECDISVRDKMTKLWTNFAKTGNTEADSIGLPTWPLFTRDSPTYMNIDKVFTIEFQNNTTKMEIFEEIYKKYEM